MKLYKFISSVILIAASISIDTFAQEQPLFTNYVNNPLEINPAIPGTETGLNMNLLTRHQWIGLDGGPASYNFAAHTPYPGQNFGLGLNIMTEKIGPVNNTNFAASYAYQIKIFDNINLSMGLQAGLNIYNAAISNLDLIESNDVNFQEDIKRTTPNFGFGGYLYTDKYYAGISAPRLIHVRLNDEYRESSEAYNPGVFLMGGYNFSINPEWVFLPSSLVLLRGGSPIIADITTQFLFQKSYYMGIHYRIGDAIGAFFNIQITEELKAGYAYDFTLNKLARANSGTHEFIISYNLQNLW
ncbi:MAG: hypothetical protein PWQ17_1683 [Anaerophaga sp.]|uniref:PorP/SprF family type IX secretion system membrane protein n=1 Tax=Anaerophaga thermohalophila TaxID=177400 RepID=UPI000237CBFB|nr:type IX secretion system membrane protein PorP/SprF [Anaerophaga thermohalophila]MDK2842178.1 hypothetical protein [Anaerophaga sp.]MDN5291703.1 hypothetical protein [Anaerophaga sp.]